MGRLWTGFVIPLIPNRRGLVFTIPGSVSGHVPVCIFFFISSVSCFCGTGLKAVAIFLLGYRAFTRFCLIFICTAVVFSER